MPNIGSQSAGRTTAPSRQYGIPVAVKVVDIYHPIFSQRDPAKAWTPASKVLAAMNLEVYEGDDEYPIVFPGATVTVSNKNGGLTAWPMEVLRPGGAAGERIKCYEWNSRLWQAIVSVINDPNSPHNFPGECGAITDDVLGALHDYWYGEQGLTEFGQEVTSLWGANGYEGYKGGQSAAAPDPEPEPIAPPPPPPAPAPAAAPKAAASARPAPPTPAPAAAPPAPAPPRIAAPRRPGAPPVVPNVEEQGDDPFKE